MSPGTQSQALDLEVLGSLQQSLDDPGGEFLLRLAAVFERQAAELMTEIAGAARRDDLLGLRDAAHSLKGSSATIGGTRLAALCAELEHWDCPREELPARVDAVRTELARFRSELAAHLAR